ncbi:MAG TPA: 1-(5-phosphoribosyl)-5-[(5-phosphoribosylamino)methylideneamino]imidazole-4-carboxamide isomerase [Candidatus Omnitrophota bacterium]|jgi:phosphoribosylformimino-5-aminoimidazole carboxamide ribotide isomerase|nr:1-(5-phosphoribosyl)-5-[(5-phosphoribosylamino)methylideneamino]imidazole-4-carboxamide isomerase [Candidatus Omnitrophota bacterium]
MNLYPAIDLYQGKVVRLTQGDYNTCKVYSHDPAAIAKEWESAGARWIHVVDLEGAKTGVISNEASVSAICKAVKAQIEFGGGMRTADDIRKVLGLGVSRVILGTKALDPVFLDECVKTFGDKLAVGLDVRHGLVKTTGWTRDGNMTLEDVLALCDKANVHTVIYTDINRDGVLDGPNFTKLTDVLARTRARVILSGGVAQLTDIEKCGAITAGNFEGVIIGKALYEKKFTLAEAFNVLPRNQKGVYP